MRRHWPTAILLALAAALFLAANLWPQAGTGSATTSQVQINPPGYQTTSQTAWIQTSTGAAQANTVTQPAVAGKTNYCTGFEITGSGATAALNVAVTLGSGGTTIANYTFVVPAGVTTQATPLIVSYAAPVVGLGPGQNMVLTVASFGGGNTAASVTMHGFSQ